MLAKEWGLRRALKVSAVLAIVWGLAIAGTAYAQDDWGASQPGRPDSPRQQDLDPKVSVLDVSVNEADKKATITFTLDLLSGRDVSVEYATQDGTAEAPGDYTSTSGLVTIPAGTMSTAIDILIIDDLDEEDVETFTVRISNVTGGKIAVGGDIATVTVVDADPGPNLPYLFAVYIITWAGFFGYVFVMARRRGEVQREIEALRAALADQDRLPEQREQGSPAQ